MKPLSDESWLVLDMLMRARQKGVMSLNRQELLNSEAVPAGVRIRLTWAALTMGGDLVKWISEDDFEVTPKGITLFEGMFKRPTPVADAIICLTDLSASTH